MNNLPKSKGHLIFAGTSCRPQVEYFVRDGHVRRAGVSEAIMPDGYRTGRWECAYCRWEQCKALIPDAHIISGLANDAGVIVEAAKESARQAVEQGLTLEHFDAAGWELYPRDYEAVEDELGRELTGDEELIVEAVFEREARRMLEEEIRHDSSTSKD